MAFYFSDKDGKLVKYAGLVGNTDDPNKLDKRLTSTGTIKGAITNLDSVTDYENLLSSDINVFGNKFLTKLNVTTDTDNLKYSSYISNGLIANTDLASTGFNNLLSTADNIDTISDLYTSENINGTFSLLQHNINFETGLPCLLMQQQAETTIDNKLTTTTNVLQVGSFTKDVIGGFQYSLSAEAKDGSNTTGVQLQTLPGLTNLGYDITGTNSDGETTHSQFQLMSFLGLASGLIQKVNDNEISLNFSTIANSASLEVKNEVTGVATGLIIKDQNLYWGKYNSNKRWVYSTLATIDDIPVTQADKTKLDKFGVGDNINPTFNNNVLALQNSLDNYLPLTGGIITGTLQAGNTIINGNITIKGNISQEGSTYETHAEQVYSKNDYITLREGSTSALTSGSYSGLEFTKYDGTNNGRLVIDNQGIARVGDVGDEQPLATREEAPVDKAIAIWDDTTKKFVTNNNLILEAISNDGATIKLCGATLKYTKSTDTWEI